MKKLLALLCAMVVFSAGAQTTNWYVDGNLYQTTSCTSGDDVTPPTAPVKHGHTFVGWYDTDLVVGTWTQSGTPSPTNPIEPTFYQDGNLILRAVGTGADLIADTYNTATGKIIRRIGMTVFDGTETWNYNQRVTYYFFDIVISDSNIDNSYVPYSTHFACARGSTSFVDIPDDTCKHGSNSSRWFFRADSFTTTTAFKQWLADQYAAGTPVTVYYPLATPVEESYTPAP